MKQALALKYRPHRFEDLIGQDTISQTLSLALSTGRLGHAYLFSGLRGSGKTSTARIFSKALVCSQGPTATPCEVCENCVMANEGRHIDIIEMDAASNRGIDDIRELIEHVKYKPSIAKYKIFIIDEVHMLSIQAFNALLKTLEEPPATVKFILATTDPLKLPPTILSRTQHFRFKKISTIDIVHHLAHILNIENVPFEQEALTLLARSGSGSLRDTITLLDQSIVYCKGSVGAEDVATMLGIVNPSILETIFTTVFAKDHKHLLSLMREIEEYDPDAVIEETIAYIKERTFALDHRFTPMISHRFFKAAAEAKGLSAMGADNSFVVTLMFAKMVEGCRIQSVGGLISTLEKESMAPAQATTVAPLVAPTSAPRVETPMTSSAPLSKSQGKEPSFADVVAKIYDRNYELGECFEKHITFVSFGENVLTWESRASDACKLLLKNNWGTIKHLVQDVYGIETTIKGISLPPLEETAPPKPREVQAEQQSDSTLASIELGNSCVEGQMPPTPEYDAGAILEDPLVKKAQELFDPKKITIVAKV